MCKWKYLYTHSHICIYIYTTLQPICTPTQLHICQTGWRLSLRLLSLLPLSFSLYKTKLCTYHYFLSLGSPHFQTWRTAKEKPYHLTRTQFQHGTPRSTIVHRCQMKVKWPQCAKPTAVCGFRVTSAANRVLHIDQSQAARHWNGS